MKWPSEPIFSSWGQALEYILPLLMWMLIFFTYTTQGGIFELFLDATIVAFITWILVAMVRWTFVWIGGIFKK